MFGDRLRELRKSKDISMDALASDYNRMFNGRLNKSTISRYENNLQEPMMNVVRNLSELLDIPVGYLTGETQEKPIRDYDNIIPMPKMTKIPLLGTIACGVPILAVEDAEEFVDLPEQVHADFALRCKGDSMINARIFDGDVVYIKKQPIVDNGEIAAVLIDNEATLKYVNIYHNKIVLEAANPTFDDIVCREEEMNTVSIIGKAVAFTSMVRYK
ncbi:MAG: S24 family peptidase [Oscillospiraceae bacterium]